MLRTIIYCFGKKAKAQKLLDLHERYPLVDAVKMAKEASKCKFDETIDLQIKLNVDPKHGDQMVRGTCVMPSGLGKKIKIAVLTSESQSLVARDAGADVYDPKQILQMLKDDTLQFDKLLATPDAMVQLKAFARQLGPRGLMPNAKAGTLVSNESLDASVRQAKAGQIEFRVDSGKNLMAPVGKVSFDVNRIIINIQAFANALNDRKPTAVKGQKIIQQTTGALIKEAILKTTMGKPIYLNLTSLNFLEDYDIEDIQSKPVEKEL